MDKSEYQKLLKGYAQPFEYGGATHYINTKMNGDALTMMQDENLSSKDRTIGLIACVLCDSEGVRIFDGDNKSDLMVVKSFDVDFQGQIVAEAMAAFFPDKKKALEEPA